MEPNSREENKARRKMEKEKHTKDLRVSVCVRV